MNPSCFRCPLTRSLRDVRDSPSSFPTLKVPAAKRREGVGGALS